MAEDEVVPPDPGDHRGRFPLRFSWVSRTDGTRISAPQNPRTPASGAVFVIAANPPNPKAPISPAILAITGHQ